MLLLLDTNVWLDNYIPERPQHAVVARLLTTALEQGHDLLFAISSVKDVYYLIARAYKQQAALEGGLTEQRASAIDEVAWGCTANMSEVATAVGADASDVWLAHKYKRIHRDFEDDLVLAAAQRAGVDYLVTSDERLLRHAPVTALNPSDMLEMLLLARP